MPRPSAHPLRERLLAPRRAEPRPRSASSPPPAPERVRHRPTAAAACGVSWRRARDATPTGRRGRGRGFLVRLPQRCERHAGMGSHSVLHAGCYGPAAGRVMMETNQSAGRIWRPPARGMITAISGAPTIAVAGPSAQPRRRECCASRGDARQPARRTERAAIKTSRRLRLADASLTNAAGAIVVGRTAGTVRQATDAIAADLTRSARESAGAAVVAVRATDEHFTSIV